mmetsp:Transcript_6570/g.12325  ORF Transcript_6570/g.12325 Transcript_6570/m.12325 type:complete len:216 (+) Transcript_6570:5186-5833(+)
MVPRVLPVGRHRVRCDVVRVHRERRPADVARARLCRHCTPLALRHHRPPVTLAKQVPVQPQREARVLLGKAGRGGEPSRAPNRQGVPDRDEPRRVHGVAHGVHPGGQRRSGGDVHARAGRGHIGRGEVVGPRVAGRRGRAADGVARDEGELVEHREAGAGDDEVEVCLGVRGTRVRGPPHGPAEVHHLVLLPVEAVAHGPARPRGKGPYRDQPVP